MNWTDLTGADMALLAGGAVGALVSLMHAVMMDRAVVRPVIRALGDSPRMHAAARALVIPLFQYSTFAWLLGGLMLMTAALTMGPEARLALGVLVGASYLYAAVANLWATQARHPGGWLLLLAIVLIVFAVLPAAWRP